MDSRPGCQGYSVGGKMVLSTNGPGTTAYQYVNELGLSPTSHHVQKLIQNFDRNGKYIIKVLNVRSKSI